MWYRAWPLGLGMPLGGIFLRVSASNTGRDQQLPSGIEFTRYPQSPDSAFRNYLSLKILGLFSEKQLCSSAEDNVGHPEEFQKIQGHFRRANSSQQDQGGEVPFLKILF